MTDAWTLNDARADRDARTYPHDPRYPPHYLRCEYYLGEERCRKVGGHTDEHEASKPK